MHFAIKDKGTVEKGLDLPQTDVIDKLQVRSGQLLEEFSPTVPTSYVKIRSVNLLDRNNQPTDNGVFDIIVKE